jgi:hypothetical protein
LLFSLNYLIFVFFRIFIFVCLSETIMLNLCAWTNLFEPSYDESGQQLLLFVCVGAF